MRILIQPHGKVSLGEFLGKIFEGEFGNFKTFQAAVAFAKRSGVQHIGPHIAKAIQNGKKTRIVVGIDHHGTSQEGLEDLLQYCHPHGEIWINHCNEKYISFHPKIYLFENESVAIAIVGSHNFTEGGLYTNDEASAIHWLDLTKEEDANLLLELNGYFDIWCNPESENSRRLTVELLQKLLENGEVVSESLSSEEDQASTSLKPAKENGKRELIFAKSEVKRSAPKRKSPKSQTAKRSVSKPKTETETVATGAKGFVMTLQRTDAGSGQTTKGTSRRSPEIFIPLAARDYFPEFWGWKELFEEDSERPGKFDRIGVKMRVGGETVLVNMMTWPIKHDFRLRSEALRSAGNVGDIMRIEKVENSVGFDYYVEIIPAGTSSYPHFLELCSNTTRNSKKTWGYYN